MVTDLRGYYAPTGKVATFINFRGLFGLDMKPAKPVGTFLARVRDAESDLHEGGLDLDPVLINLFILNGLSEKSPNLPGLLHPRQETRCALGGQD